MTKSAMTAAAPEFCLSVPAPDKAEVSVVPGDDNGEMGGTMCGEVLRLSTSVPGDAPGLALAVRRWPAEYEVGGVYGIPEVAMDKLAAAWLRFRGWSVKPPQSTSEKQTTEVSIG